MKEKEKVWVIGAKGLVGTDMVNYLKAKKIPVIGSTKKEADVTDFHSVRVFCEKHKPTTIINCSAYVNVDLAEGKDRDLAYKINVKGPSNLGELAKENRLRLIHIGTDYVFDGDKQGDYRETDRVHPINHYGMTKLEGEQALLEACPSAVCVRTASLYGLAKPGLVSSIIKALETEEEVKGIVDQTSTPTYVPHLVEALWGVRREKGIFHFVNKGYASRFELIEEIKKYAEAKNKPLKCTRLIGIQSRESGRAALRPRRSVLSTHKIEPFLPRSISSWQAALRQYLREIGWVTNDIS